MKNTLLLFTLLLSSTSAFADIRTQDACLEQLENTPEYKAQPQEIVLSPIQETQDYYSTLQYKDISGRSCAALYRCSLGSVGYEVRFVDDSCGGSL